MTKVFISYSWASEVQQLRVEQWAKRLTDAGFEVVLDKTHLKLGQDVYFFMEKVVNDSSIAKVLLMCDAEYTAKADSRGGGVGVETQLVASKVYKDVDQTKFIPVICERRNGEVCCPAFLQSRKYIDFSTEENVQRNFPELLKVIHDSEIVSSTVTSSTNLKTILKPCLELTLTQVPCLSDSKIDEVYEDMLYVAKCGLLPPFELVVSHLNEKSEHLAALDRLKNATGQQKRERILLLDQISEATRTKNLVHTALSIAFREVPLKMLSSIMGYPGIAKFLKGYFRIVSENCAIVTGLTKIDLWRDKDPNFGFAIWLNEDEFHETLGKTGFDHPTALTLSGFYMVDLPQELILSKALPTLVHRLTIEQHGLSAMEIDKLINPLAWKMGLG